MSHRRRIRIVALVSCVAWLSCLAATPRAADPLRVILLVDSSTSMSTMLNEFRSGLSAFVQAVPQDVEVAFISTGGQMRIRTPPTTDRTRLLDATSRFASDGGANALVDTMLESDKRFLQPANRRPIFVVVTTDQPSMTIPVVDRYNDFLRDFVRRHGRAHAVVIRNAQQMGFASEVLENLTSNTDGLYTVVAVPNSLAVRMRAIAAEVAAQE